MKASICMEIEKKACCRYDPSVDFEGARGGLRIFLPTARGYVNFNLVYSVKEDRNCNTWRLSKAFAVDDHLENEYELTPKGAEWDMAVKLDGRPDFIGGYAHGDEVYTALTVSVDGRPVAMDSLRDLTSFAVLRITVTSNGFDPSDPTTRALKHFKEFIITGEGITLNQRVEWLDDYTLGSSYLAMMPPLKALTDLVYTDADPTPKEAIASYGSVPGATEAVVYGTTSGISFRMSVPKYPSLAGGNKFLLTDNHGRPYNKMYFVVCKDATVSKGDVWESTTQYRIEIAER